MAPPTPGTPVVSTNFASGASNNKNTPALTWAAADIIVVWGMTGDNAITLNTPTATGLTFALQTGYPTNTASRGKLYLWIATAGGSGSQAIACTISSGVEGGIVATAWTNSSGVGAIPTPAGGTSGAATVSLTATGADSAVSMGWVNWNQNTGARTYLSTGLGTATERSYYTSGTFATCATASNAQTTGSGAKTVGMSAPTLDSWLIGAVELLAPLPPITNAPETLIVVTTGVTYG